MKRKKKKKPIPPEVLAEWRQWRNKANGPLTTSSTLEEEPQLHPDDEAAFLALQELDDPPSDGGDSAQGEIPPEDEGPLANELLGFDSPSEDEASPAGSACQAHSSTHSNNN